MLKLALFINALIIQCTTLLDIDLNDFENPLKSLAAKLESSEAYSWDKENV